MRFGLPIKIVAEIGCNHMGSVALAKEMIREAALCGCTHVKLQKRHLGSIDPEIAERPYFGPNSFGETYLDHRCALEFDGLAWRDLKCEAERNKVGFFGTAFDLDSVDFLCNLNLPYLKIGSGQVKDGAFLDGVIGIDNYPPLIVSTGMCTDAEVLSLVERVPVSILTHTTSSYPCPEDEINLRWLGEGMQRFISLFRLPEKCEVSEIGLSGHYTAGNGAIEAAAVALGATYIERHFTLDRTWKGTDQAASLEPVGMRNVVKAIRQVERGMGDGKKRIMPSEEALARKLRGKN